MSANSTIVSGALALPSASPFCGMPLNSASACLAPATPPAAVAFGALVSSDDPDETATRMTTTMAASARTPPSMRIRRRRGSALEGVLMPSKLAAAPAALSRRATGSGLAMPRRGREDPTPLTLGLGADAAVRRGLEERREDGVLEVVDALR